MLAVQAQDPRGARLAIRARSRGVTAADVDRCLTEDRSLLITTLNRGTLHLVRSEDYAWLQALTTPRLRTGNARRLAQEGVSPDDAERGVAIVERALADDGPLPRAELRDRIAAAGIPVEGQAFVHVVMLASLRGLVVRGPMVGRQHAFVLVRDWLGEQPAVDRERALAELARRYLAGHGPADERDLARWAGVPLRDARAGLAAIGGEVVKRDDGLVDLAKRPGGEASAERPPTRLLGAFEPVLLGWRSRADFVENEADIVAGGIFRPFAMVRGRAAATWRLRGGEVEIERFARVARADAATLDADADAVLRYLGPAWVV